MTCPLCKLRGKTWEGNDPKCAFDKNGVFTTDNWNCATMNALRDISGEFGGNDHLDTFHFRDDQDAGSIGVVRVTGGNHAGYIVMTWYKQRGRTGQAMFIQDDEEPRPLTLDIAVEALRTRGLYTGISRSETNG